MFIIFMYIEGILNAGLVGYQASRFLSTGHADWLALVIGGMGVTVAGVSIEMDRRGK
jgi:hypothetical protein